MLLSTHLLLVSLATLSSASPLRVSLNDDEYQVLFAASSNVPGDTQSTASPSATTNSATVAQRITTSSTPPATTIWFAPDDAIPSTTSVPHKLPQATRPIVAAYYPDWTAAQLPPELVDFDRLDWVDFAFAVPDSVTFTPKFLETDSEDLLNRLVSAAHSKKKKVKVSIGGWTGSGHFSDAVNEVNRNAFAADIHELYNKFDIDGIDIDWEYPGEEGAAGNTHTPADSANFLAFLQILRLLLPPGAHITAATQVWPFVDANGEHSKDVSAFAQVLDWVLLMNYDIWGSSPAPGANAPLSNACHNSSQPEANAHAAIASWTAAGFPAQKIMLGLPAYGYVSRTNALNLRTRRREFQRTPIAALATDNVESQTSRGVMTVMSEAGSAESGQIQFNALIAQGALVRNLPGVLPYFTGGAGFERIWDGCSSTPFLRSVLAQQIVTYDDPESLSMKAAFANKAGILGVNMWDAHGDTAGWDLIDGVRRGLGIE